MAIKDRREAKGVSKVYHQVEINDSSSETKWCTDSGLLFCWHVGFWVQTVKLISCMWHLQANGTDTSPSLWGQQREPDCHCSDTLFKWHVDRHPLNPVNPSWRFFIPSPGVSVPLGPERSPIPLPVLLAFSLFTVNCLQISTFYTPPCVTQGARLINGSLGGEEY